VSIEPAAGQLHPMLASALVQLEAVRVVRYGHDAGLD
jgi:hypothetical protein